MSGRHRILTIAGMRSNVGPNLGAFLKGWQPRQRRTLGMLNSILTRLHDVAGAHPEWAGYDLLTHLLAALHLVIENDRLTGGHTEQQIIDELVRLVALEHPDDPPTTHRDVAGAVVDVLTNARQRRLRLRDSYLHAPDGVVEHREYSFSFVRAVGDEDSGEPTLRATPEAINVFQNLVQFDPSDRAAAERYRSQRMLAREEYDEVLTSVERRATSVHGLRSELDGIVRRINYSIREVDYAPQVIPKLDEVLETVSEQVLAEERFAETIADLAHHAAPDHPRLQRIATGLRGLVAALMELQSAGRRTRRTFEAEQDRQLFTYRRVSINPQSQLLEPLLRLAPAAVVELLSGPLLALLGPRSPAVLHVGALVDRSLPGGRSEPDANATDPFDLGARRGDDDTVTPAMLAAVQTLLERVQRPTRLSTLIAHALQYNLEDPHVADQLPWALAVTVAIAYGQTGNTAERDSDIASETFDHDSFAVVATGHRLSEDGPVAGDDLIIVRRGEARAP